MYEVEGNVIEGNFFSSHWHQDSASKKSQEFIEKYRTRSEKVDVGNALGDDCVFLFADAVLGLSVSYFIITENHGGEMAVETQPESGSKFIIRLPIERRKS